jgi:hypothetical protein
MQKNEGSVGAPSPLFILNMASMYTDLADDEKPFKFNNDRVTRIQAQAAKLGVNNDFSYIDNASEC